MSRRQRLRFTLVLAALIAIGPMTIDMYLPAFPAITTDLQTTAAAVQLTLTGTLLGLAVGQLLIGPWSDAYGRRLPLLAGLVSYIVASLLCALAPNIALLGAFRVLQGLSMAAASVVAMAVVRDLFSGDAFARMLSRLLVVMGVAPILAPSLGSALLNWTEWQGVFVALAVFGGVLIVAGRFGLAETLPPQRRRPARVGATLRTYAMLLRDRTFIALTLATGLTMSALFSYVAGAPFVLQEEFGLTEQQFGLMFGVGAVGLTGATQLNARLLRRYSARQLLLTGLITGTAAALGLLVVAATGVGGLFGLLVPLWLVLAGAGLAMPNAPALAMSRHGEAAGTAAALLGFVQFGVGAVAAPMVGVLGSDRVAMAGVVTFGLTAALVIVGSLVLRSRVSRDRGRGGA